MLNGSVNVKFEIKTNILFPKPLKVIADVIIDQLVTFGYVMGRLTSPTSIEKMSQKPEKFPSACVIFNKMVIYVNIITFVL